MLTMEGLRRRRAEILVVARRRRAHRIAVFGSVARGDAHPDSDLDLLVDFEPGVIALTTKRSGGTLRDDVPRMAEAIRRWRQAQA